MVRNTFIKRLAKETGWKTADFALALDCIEAFLAGQLRLTGQAEIPGVVKLIISELPPRAAHQFRNSTGILIDVPAKPARKRLRALVSKRFEDRVLPTRSS